MQIYIPVLKAGSVNRKEMNINKFKICMISYLQIKMIVL